MLDRKGENAIVNALYFPVMHTEIENTFGSSQADDKVTFPFRYPRRKPGISVRKNAFHLPKILAYAGMTVVEGE
ncbi:hypothetical protein CS369_14660 [Candidatus Symbiopectobacterium sp. 'North America']|nr:hypothetical protein [Candidatus Symbiopectobacterium sp. 'North America']